MSENFLEYGGRREKGQTPSREDILSEFYTATKPRYTLVDYMIPLPSPPPPVPKGTPSPEMFSPRQAWRRLQASTGCEIAIGSFYRWIRSGRLYTVRLGGKIFVPVSALESLIENCLRGESL